MFSGAEQSNVGEMIEYRSFHNTDPPRLMRLWNECSLGRGAAVDFPGDAFDLLVLSEPYFDKRGLIVACAGDDVVGFVHAGFGQNAAGSALDFTSGVICAVMVRPDHRRRGVGRELISRAEAYLKSKGAVEIFAGESSPRNPFYLGLYGGSESVGFLESDMTSHPFFTGIGYQPADRFLLFQRDIRLRNDPFDPRLVAIRRKMQLGVMDRPQIASWWWMTRQGRFDTLCFVLLPETGAEPIAAITCWGMDLYGAMRRQRTVGLSNLVVVEQERRKGIAKALLLDVIRRLRDELVTHLEIAANANNPAAVSLFKGLGFEQVDAGTVFKRPVA